MTTKYIGRKTTVRDSFKEYADKKIAKLDKFFENDAVATVVVSNNTPDETVEVTIKSAGMFFRAEKTSHDRIVSLDMVMDVLTRQIVKNKQKLDKKFRVPVPDDFFDPKEEDTKVPELVKRKSFYVGVMTPDEAVLQMEMIGHEFFMFRDAESGEINVVYKRKDGNYGLLIPEE